MERNNDGQWIVDELAVDPHIEDWGVIARDDNKWYIIDIRRPDATPKAYRRNVYPDYIRLTYAYEYLMVNCIPRDGYRITIGRAATEEEIAIIVGKYQLADADISGIIEVSHGAVYGADAEVRFQARQISVNVRDAISVEAELKALGIEASNGCAGSVTIRVR